MNPNEAVISCFQNAIKFKGRASRPEFWWFTAFGVIIGLILSADFFYNSTILNVMATIIGLIILLPNVSVSVRRLHDVNKSGYWLIPFALMHFIPDQLIYRLPHFLPLVFAGLVLCYIILLIYWLTLKGDEFENDFGQPPLIESQSK